MDIRTFEWRNWSEQYAALRKTKQYGNLQRVFAFCANKKTTMFDALQCFLAVADGGNFSEAARRLGLAVSSVSRKIDTLEAHMGASLFRRSSRRVALTDAGERLLPRARQIVADMDEAKTALADADPAPRGLLTVTAPPSLGRRHIVPAIATFLRDYPLLEIDLHTSDEVIDLAARRVDVAIRIGVLPSSELVATFLAPNRRIACASPAYLARHGRPQSPADLSAHNCLAFATGAPSTDRWCFAGFNGNKTLPVSGTLRTDDVDSMLQAAIAGVGIAHLSNWVVGGAIAAGELVPLFGGERITRAKVRSAIHAVRLPGRSHPVKAQLFIEHLRAYFAALPNWDELA
jgi:DNA-binding transcriptional LysR family regulator